MSNINPCSIPPMRYLSDDSNEALIDSPSNTNTSHCKTSGRGNSCPDNNFCNCSTEIYGIDEDNIFYNLISNWKNFTELEKLSTFMPYIYQVELTSDSVINAEKDNRIINEAIAEFTKISGRKFIEADLEISHQGIRYYLLKFDKVDQDKLPSSFKETYIAYGRKRGVY